MTAHVIVAALVTLGWISREPVKKHQIRNIVISWIVTVPVSAALAVGVFALVRPFF